MTSASTQPRPTELADLHSRLAALRIRIGEIRATLDGSEARLPQINQLLLSDDLTIETISDLQAEKVLVENQIQRLRRQLEVISREQSTIQNDINYRREELAILLRRREELAASLDPRGPLAGQLAQLQTAMKGLERERERRVARLASIDQRLAEIGE